MKNIKMTRTGCFNHIILNKGEVYNLDNEMADEVLRLGYGVEHTDSKPLKSLTSQEGHRKETERGQDNSGEVHIDEKNIDADPEKNHEKSFGDKLKNKMLKPEKNKDDV